MKTTEDIKMYHFFDEAGDPQILGRGGINLVTEGKSSKVFSVGYLEVKDPKEVINYIHSLGKKAGVSVKPGTDVEVMKPYLSDIDLVLVMTVEPGFGGQSYIEEMCVQIILPQLQAPFEMLVTIEYAEEKDDADVVVRYSGEANDPLHTNNDLSLLLAKKATDHIVSRYDPTQNLANIVNTQIH